MFIYIIIDYFILRSSHSSCRIKDSISQIMAKPLNISAHNLLCAYSSYSFPVELVMNTTNPLPTTRIFNELKNKDLMASLQMDLDWAK